VSTDTLEPQAEETTVAEAGADEPDLELAIADAHHEGMPVPPEPGAEPTATSDAYADRPTGMAWAMDQIIEVNRQVIDQKSVVKAKAAELKDEKEVLEELQTQLNTLITEAEKARKAADPDPERFPLFDKPADPNAEAEAKAAINEQFSKPEAVAPLPAADFEEAFRRAARDESMMTIPGVTVRTRRALNKAGIKTVADLGRFTEDGQGVSSIKGVGEAGAEEIRGAIVAFGERVVAEWNLAHPEAGSGLAAEDDIDEAVALAAKASGATT
jgi:hypothetical protein